jgi:hypothetical protein
LILGKAITGIQAFEPKGNRTHLNKKKHNNNVTLTTKNNENTRRERAAICPTQIGFLNFNIHVDFAKDDEEPR